MSSRLRALIVDDEAPARRAMEHMLQELPTVEVAGTAGDGMHALEWLAQHGADLLLLDI
ncbi:MAG: LytR/AlgR family response regulator transcription factor, partial [Dyella sp.]